MKQTCFVLFFVAWLLPASASDVSSCTPETKDSREVHEKLPFSLSEKKERRFWLA